MRRKFSPNVGEFLEPRKKCGAQDGSLQLVKATVEPEFVVLIFL
jgi:hypothetical protein